MPETPINPERQFVVALKDHHGVIWGPFGSQGDAEDFAEFVTEEIDPAEVRALSAPVGELLAWRRSMQDLQEGGQP